MAELLTAHDHRGYPLRGYVGTGTWVRSHGEWCRPLNVWLYRGAWRVVCWACLASVRSDDVLFDGGWRTQAAAFDAALTHCRSCVEAR